MSSYVSNLTTFSIVNPLEHFFGLCFSFFNAGFDRKHNTQFLINKSFPKISNKIEEPCLPLCSHIFDIDFWFFLTY